MRKFIQEVDLNLINRVTFEAWPENCFNCIEDPALIKEFYNNAYRNFESRLEEVLKRFHPAALIVEAYLQLDVWTAIFRDLDNQVKGNEEFLPYGRYGWRYVIEKSMERLNSDFDYHELKPDRESCALMFTLFFGMSHASEYSNYFHYLGDKFPSAKLVFSPDSLLRHPQLNKTDEDLWEQIRLLRSQRPDYEKYADFLPDSDTMDEKVNAFVNQHFEVDLDEIHLFIEKGLITMCNETEASVLIQPMPEFIAIIWEETGLTVEKIFSIISLIFYHVDSQKTPPRDFLRRSQPDRMLNYAGMVISLDNHLNAIYDEKNAERVSAEKHNVHVILSPAMVADWILTFIPRLVLGLRTDLKENEVLNKELAKLESFFHKEIFENQVMGLLRKRGFYCFNLAKLDRKPIDCGEIDILAYSDERKELFIVECKAFSPAVDARGIGQTFSDHYKQKKYHKKFMRKIEWTNKNVDAIKSIIKQNAGFENEIVVNEIRPFFITCYNSVVSLFENNYNYMTYYEFDRFLEK